MTLIYFNVGQFKTVINYPVDSGTEVDMSTPSLYAPRLPVLNDPSSVLFPFVAHPIVWWVYPDIDLPPWIDG